MSPEQIESIRNIFGQIPDSKKKDRMDAEQIIMFGFYNKIISTEKYHDLMKSYFKMRPPKRIELMGDL